jgi:hypothetical protein
MIRLDHIINSWRTVREDASAAVEDFPEAGIRLSGGDR